MRRTICHLVMGLAMSASHVHGTSRPGTDAHYLVFEARADGSATPVFATRVRLRGQLRGASLQARSRARAASRSHDHVAVRLTDATGAVAFEDVVGVPILRRGEFHGAATGDGTHAIERSTVTDATRAFVVRVPAIPGATLDLTSGLLTGPARFDLDRVSPPRATATGAAPPPLPGWTSGDPANRVDVLILGDGYTAGEAALFDADATALASGFFGISPYDEYRNYVNVSTLFTASTASGADQPAYLAGCSEYARVQSCCADAAAIPTTATTVATAFDATFCSFGVQRLLTVDSIKVLVAAAAEPDWDEILVLVNTSTYGGSGGPFSVVSTHVSTTALAQHEYGHSFTLLADEYDDPVPTVSPCSDVNTSLPACEPNVTDVTSRSAVKWNRWIAPSQPVPSTSPPPEPTDAGLWRGARYQTSGMYRQGYLCAMKVLGGPFGDVASEAYALRLYGGGWGVPAGGIDAIEPGSELPAPGAVAVPYPGDTFSATVLGPQSGPNVDVGWWVDGVLVASEALPTGATATHDLVTTPGLHTLELRVTDVSPIIHPTMRSPHGRTWTVTVGPNLCGTSSLDAGETCDDGNQTPGDGCSATCDVEPCWSCVSVPSSCTPTSGGPCSDGEPCTTGDICASGVCTASTTIGTCTSGDACCPTGCRFVPDDDCPAPTPIAAKKLVFKDALDPTRRKLGFQTASVLIDTTVGTGIDPVTNGAFLQLYNATGTGESVCLPLPSAGWSTTGAPPHVGYRYADGTGVHGPCKSVVVTDGKLVKVSCAANVQSIDYSLDETAQGAMAVRFVSGAHDYCARFGGVRKIDSGLAPLVPSGRGQFNAKDAPAPLTCPTPPAACP